jgi:hypothetical protein
VLKAKRESYMKYLKSLETTKNPEEFWNYVRRVINGSSNSPTAPIKDPINAETTDGPNRKAKIFLDKYVPVVDAARILDEREATMEEKVEEYCNDDSPAPLNEAFTMTELDATLRNLHSKAMGSDNIQNKMMSNLSKANRVLWLWLLNLMHQAGYVPRSPRRGKTL